MIPSQVPRTVSRLRGGIDRKDLIKARSEGDALRVAQDIAVSQGRRRGLLGVDRVSTSNDTDSVIGFLFTLMCPKFTVPGSGGLGLDVLSGEA